jgi:hypothetical protein
MTRYLLLFDSYGLVFPWGALSNERTSQSFVYAVGLALASAVSLFVAMEVFVLVSTRVPLVFLKVKVKVTLRLTVSQSVSLGFEPHLGLMTRYLLLFDSYCLDFVWRPL